jgi:hypothetical protein
MSGNGTNLYAAHRPVPPRRGCTTGRAHPDRDGKQHPILMEDPSARKRHEHLQVRTLGCHRGHGRRRDVDRGLRHRHDFASPAGEPPGRGTHLPAHRRARGASGIHLRRRCGASLRAERGEAAPCKRPTPHSVSQPCRGPRDPAGPSASETALRRSVAFAAPPSRGSASGSTHAGRESYGVTASRAGRAHSALVLRPRRIPSARSADRIGFSHTSSWSGLSGPSCGSWHFPLPRFRMVGKRRSRLLTEVRHCVNAGKTHAATARMVARSTPC